jgi:hypothetical protein
MLRWSAKIKPIFQTIFLASQIGGVLCSLVADFMKSPLLCLCSWVLLLPGSLIGGFQSCTPQGGGPSSLLIRLAVLANLALLGLTAFLFRERQNDN